MKRGFVEVEGLRLRVVEEGAGEPVVLLHGWAASHRVWRRSVPLLAERRRVVAPDLPGFGDSDKPDAPYTLEWFSGILAAMYDALGLTNPPLVAHSMGGAIGAAFSLGHADRVGRLVLVCAVLGGSAGLTMRQRLPMLPGVRRLLYPLSKVGVLRRRIAGSVTHKVPLDGDILADPGRATYASLIRSYLSLRAANLAPRLAALGIPVLAMAAEFDGIVHPSQIEAVRREAPRIPVEVIPDCGHCPMHEVPGDFVRRIGRFLGDD